MKRRDANTDTARWQCALVARPWPFSEGAIDEPVPRPSQHLAAPQACADLSSLTPSVIIVHYLSTHLPCSGENSATCRLARYNPRQAAKRARWPLMTLRRAQHRCTGCVVRHKLLHPLAPPEAQSNERFQGPPSDREPRRRVWAALVASSPLRGNRLPSPSFSLALPNGPRHAAAGLQERSASTAVAVINHRSAPECTVQHPSVRVALPVLGPALINRCGPCARNILQS